MQIYDEINNCWVSHRSLPEYYVRKQKLKDCWIKAVVLMLFLPINLVFVLALFGCFLSFMFLDEVAYDLSGYQVRE